MITEAKGNVTGKVTLEFLWYCRVTVGQSSDISEWLMGVILDGPQEVMVNV